MRGRKWIDRHANELERRLHRPAADQDTGRPDARDARRLPGVLLALPKRQHDQPRWQAAAAELIKAAQHGGPFVMIARIAVSRAVHGVEGVGPTPKARATKQEKSKAKRANQKRP